MKNSVWFCYLSYNLNSVQIKTRLNLLFYLKFKKYKIFTDYEKRQENIKK